MDILFLSHCVPNPPDKGDKIRAFHELTELSRKHRVHLACFARRSEEIKHAHDLQDRCASVYVEPLTPAVALAGAAVRFGMGGCLTTSFYNSRRMRRHVASMRSLPLGATVAYSSAMAQYAPPEVPLWLDMVDVDSEKWLQYGRARWPGLAYRIEGGRLRAREAQFAARAACTFLTTPLEQGLMQDIAPLARIACFTNGVDFDFFDPSAVAGCANLATRRFVVFVGSMDYYPNWDACCWFAGSVFAELRRCWPDVEFFIVGRNPSKAVLRLSKQDGVTVTGAVADVRPYLAFARAVVAPLRIARGIQNKVLEALAMGKRVYSSAAVCDTFGETSPDGVILCDSASEYISQLESVLAAPLSWEREIRQAARKRFSWHVNLQKFADELASARLRSTVPE